MDRFVDMPAQHGIVETGEIEAPAAAAAALFAPPALLCYHRDRQAHQRAHIGGNQAVRTGHQDDVVFAGDSGHHLGDARIAGPGQGLDALEQRDLLARAQRRERVVPGIEFAARPGHQALGHLHPARSPARDRPGGSRRRQQGLLADRVGIGERRALANHRADPDTLVDREVTGLDDALLQPPAFAARELEIEVAVVDAMPEHLGQGPFQVPFVYSIRVEQSLTGDYQRLVIVFDVLHDAMLPHRRDRRRRMELDHIGARPAAIDPVLGGEHLLQWPIEHRLGEQ